METTKELPHDYLAEKSLIGSLIIDSKSFDRVSELSLSSEDFYNPQYGFLFQAVRDLSINNEPIDFVSVCAKLNDMGKLKIVGGQSGVLEIVEEQASSANVYHYGKVVKDKSIIRDLVLTAQRVANNGVEFVGNVEDYINEVESSFFKLTGQTRSGQLKDLKAYLRSNLNELKDLERKAGEISGIKTGYKLLDKRLLGLKAGQLVILAARPGMGKTALALNIAVNACESSELPVAIFSLEMLGEELSMRVISSQAKVNSQRLRTKEYHDTDLRQISHAVQKLSNLPFYINDASDITLLDIKSQCRRIKMEQGLGLVIVDYIQLMKADKTIFSREQQIAEISRGLKNLAKELGCPVLALSQLNRGAESRVDKRPMLADLRESGAIEQDADVVLLIYRDEVYNKENSKDPGVAEIIIGKNRSGEIGMIKLTWIGQQTRFENLASTSSQQTYEQHQ